MTPGEKLAQILLLLENKNLCCNRDYKSSDDFEIAFQFFQEYAESIGFSLCFQKFGLVLKFFTCKNEAPELCMLPVR